MPLSPLLRYTDLGVVWIANLMNLIMVAVFYLRTTMVHGHLATVGWTWLLFMGLLFAASLINLRAHRAWWSYTLPLLLALFLLLELILDYLLQLKFRDTALLGPYLFLYYLAILGMIGYAFLSSRTRGTITLATYFLSQFAALYSYRLVGHG